VTTGGHLCYEHNLSGLERHRVESREPLPVGAHRLGFRFTRTGEHRGTGALLVDDRVVAEAEIPHFTPGRFSLTGAGLTCGYATGLPPSDDYQAPFRFTGRLRRVLVEVDGAPRIDAQAEAEAAVTSQ
jgi:hypothetical protein